MRFFRKREKAVDARAMNAETRAEVERLARIALDAANLDGFEKNGRAPQAWDDLNPANQEQFRAIARAILAETCRR